MASYIYNGNPYSGKIISYYQKQAPNIQNYTAWDIYLKKNRVFFREKSASTFSNPCF